MTENIELPYKPIGELANRVTLREMSKRGRETYLIPFKKLKLREGFNTRTVYRGIEELAESIKAQGLIQPLTVDVIANGTALIEQGNRRFRALQMLWDQKWLQKAEKPGLSLGNIECFRNERGTTELDRIKRILSSNHAEPLTAYEISDTILRLKEVFKLETKEIVEIVGYSRQQVENMLILAKEPVEVRQALEENLMKPTTAIVLARSGKTEEEKVELVNEAKATGRVIKQSDIKPEPVRPLVPPQDDEDDEDFTKEVIVHPPVSYLKGDDKEELRQANKSTRPPSQPKVAGEKRTHEMKDEEIFCSETLQMLDQIQVIVDKLPPAQQQAAKDITIKLGACIQRVSSVREFVRKAEIRTA